MNANEFLRSRTGAGSEPLSAGGKTVVQVPEGRGHLVSRGPKTEAVETATPEPNASLHSTTDAASTPQGNRPRKSGGSVPTSHTRPPDEENAMSEDDRFQTLTRERYEAEVAQVADKLRRIAAEVEREGTRTTNSIGAPCFGWAAHSVVHAVLWGLANANLDGLLLKAAEADEASNEANCERTR